MKLVARRIYETLSDKVMFFVLLFNFFSVCSKSGSLNVIYSMLHLTNVGLTHSVRYETILHGTVSQLHIKNGHTRAANLMRITASILAASTLENQFLSLNHISI